MATIRARHPERAQPWITTLMAVVLVGGVEQGIEHFARQSVRSLERNDALTRLAAVRARLEGLIYANLYRVRGLTAVIALWPDLDQDTFARVARYLVDGKTLRNIGAAPDMVIRLMYPLAGNEAAIGLDYRRTPGQRDMALRARDSGQTVIAGPLPLVQGGIGVIVREPVMLDPVAPDSARRFWGLVSAVIDVQTLYDLAGLRDPRLTLDLAIRGIDGSGARGPVFYGDAALFGRDPVTLDVSLPGGSWQLAGLPKGGWGRAGTVLAPMRIMGLLAALAAGVMTWRLARDIRARRHMEEVVRRLNAELEERVRQRTAELATANQELETFTYSVSHDLKAPLRSIDGYSRLLQEDHGDSLDGEGRLFLANVRQGVAHMNQLIDDLLAYARMEQRDFSDQRVNLARAVHQVLEEKQDEIAACGAVVRVDIEPGLTVHADPEGLALVLRNLIDNGLKFSRAADPPMLDLRTRPGEASVILEVRDNGIGFDPRFAGRLFEIFQRLQRTGDYPGTGVGLALVRKAIQRMGGRVWAESEPGQGAVFFLELPR